MHLRPALIVFTLIASCGTAAAQGVGTPGVNAPGTLPTPPSQAPMLAPDPGTPNGSTVVGAPLALDPAQKQAILSAVRKEKGRVRQPAKFSASVGAPVPPAIELYALPDSVLSEVPATTIYRYTLVGDQVVLVDPVRMRVVDVLH